MKLFIQTTIATLLAISSTFLAYAQQYNSGVVNFNVNPSPAAGIKRHKVSLYGCNTKIDTTVDWDRDNQVLAFVPFGERKTQYKHKGKLKSKSYYVSKYYLVPVQKKAKPGTR